MESYLFEDLDEYEFSIIRAIEIGEEGLLNITAGKVEGVGRFVLIAGGGVRVDPPRSLFRHEPLRLGQELSSQAFTLCMRIHGDPVEIEAVRRPWDRAETGVA